LTNEQVLAFIAGIRPDLSVVDWKKADVLTVLSWALPLYAKKHSTILSAVSPSLPTAEATSILDRWLKAMDNPDTEPPLEVHHRDIEVLRAAIGGLPITPAKGMAMDSNFAQTITFALIEYEASFRRAARSWKRQGRKNLEGECTKRADEIAAHAKAFGTFKEATTTTADPDLRLIEVGAAKDAVTKAADDVVDVHGFHNADEYAWAKFFQQVEKRMQEATTCPSSKPQTPNTSSPTIGPNWTNGE
jgi:hypothetical protein